MSAPVLITVQHGRDLRYELLNSCARKAVRERDITGKTPSQAFPELEQWLRKIAAAAGSGQPYAGVNEPVTLNWSGTGRIETRYLAFVCQPLLGEDGAVDGTLAASDWGCGLRGRS